jgi:hypothetical protein
MEVADDKVIKQEVIEQVKPVPEEIVKLKETADNNVQEIMAIDMDIIQKRKEILTSIDSFGMDTMKRSSEKNSLLQVQVGNLSKSGDEGGIVAKGLTDLQIQLKDLDPSAIDFMKTGFLAGMIIPQS